VKQFRAVISVEEVEIIAESEEQAEEIYNAYFSGQDCPVHDRGFIACKCATVFEIVDHTMTEIGELQNA